MRLLRVFVSFGVALSAMGSAFAAGPVRVETVEAELVSEVDALVPGQPFTLGLRLKHDEGWHTQWSNSPITWTLPDGFVAGPIRWPKPSIGYYGAAQVYNVTGEIFLLAEITPPASLPPGTPVELGVRIAWWAWQSDGGTPTEATLTLELPVASAPGADTPWAALIRQARAALPTASPELSMIAYREGPWITLVIDAARELNPDAGEFSFFEDQSRLEIGSDDTQWRTHRQVRIARRELAYDPKPERFSGLLRAKNGWFPNGPELHTIACAIVDGAPPPIVPLEPVAGTVLRTLQSTADYGKLRALYVRRSSEGGEKWVKSVYGQRLRATVRRLHAEAASVATIDPEHPDKREVNFTSEGRVLRLSSLVPSWVDKDEIYRGSIGNIICRFILEGAQGDGLMPIPILLPPAARAAIDRGIIAAQRSDYDLAIRCFEEARAHAPRAPEVYLNLGLAEGKRPGRELRAVAWLGAYLTADPYGPAPNEAAVRAQMNVLFEKNQRNLATWLLGVQEAAGRFAEGRWVALYQTVNMWADAGEIVAAQKNAAMIPPFDSEYSYSQHSILKAQIKAGDIPGAQKSADLIKDTVSKVPAEAATPSGYAGAKTGVIYALTQAQTELAEAQILSGDIMGGRKSLAAAQKSAALIRYATYESMAQPAIAEGLLKAGDREAAEAVLVTAQRIVDGNPEPNAKVSELLGIARVQLLTGNVAGARQTFASAQDVAGLAGWSAFAEGKAEAQALGGDLAGAHATVALMENKTTSNRARDAIARAQAKRGDFAGARATALLIDREYEKSRSLLAIRAAEGQLGSTQREWLALLADEDRSHPCPLNHAIFTDFAGYLKSLGKSEEPRHLFEVLRAISETQTGAKNTLRQMVDSLGTK